jgi:ATP phosphoribosyltransferase regulatory subunit
VGGVRADAELIGLASAAVRRAGLEEFAIDVGDVGIVHALVGPIDAAPAAALIDAVGRKDEWEVRMLAREHGVRFADALVALLQAHGTADVLDDVESLLRETPAAAALARLRQLATHLGTLSLGVPVTFDLSDVRELGYYTGTVFQLLARGPGDPLGSGGRYDEVLGRFGLPLAAAGFAVDVDRLAWAMRASNRRAESPLRFVVQGPADHARTRAHTLRAAGYVAAVVDEGVDAAQYARAWSFDGWVAADGTSASVARAFGDAEVGRPSQVPFPTPATPSALSSWVIALGIR